jgi:hypothetical protein
MSTKIFALCMPGETGRYATECHMLQAAYFLDVSLDR